ncbi:MAG: phenylalanine--tRNA ligase subunit alpha [Endomicrobiales bacterium]
MSKPLEQIEQDAKAEIASARTPEDIEKIRVVYLGRKGALTEILRGLAQLPMEQRKHQGEQANRLRHDLEVLVDDKMAQLKDRALDAELRGQKVDVSPAFAFPIPQGHPHPLIQTLDEITRIFKDLGFDVARGPEIETDYYNFEALNIPKDHPARDTQDTFYLAGSQKLLRTHTSPVQVHVMEKQQPPVRIIVPGRVYRNEATDASHSAIFHQVEGLAVDENITFADLKGTLTLFIHRLYGPDTRVRFRPSHFQFTEPSAELDIGCTICKGKGCRVCKGSGWLEMLGCGMVHPNVFKAVNYDTEKYTGFAFGIGVERITMLKYGIDDMRLMYENNLQFLKQF